MCLLCEWENELVISYCSRARLNCSLIARSAGSVASVLIDGVLDRGTSNWNHKLNVITFLDSRGLPSRFVTNPPPIHPGLGVFFYSLCTSNARASYSRSGIYTRTGPFLSRTAECGVVLHVKRRLCDSRIALQDRRMRGLHKHWQWRRPGPAFRGIFPCPAASYRGLRWGVAALLTCDLTAQACLHFGVCQYPSWKGA